MTQDIDIAVFLMASSSTPDEVLRPFEAALQHAQIRLKVERRETSAVYAADEWYIPAAIALGLAAPYFAAILAEAGRDHYAALKRAVGSFWETLFGPNRILRTSVIASAPGKVDPEWPYARVFTITARANNGLSFKLYVYQNSRKEDLDAAFSCLVEFVTSVNSGAADELLARRLQEIRPYGGMFLVSYEPSEDRLRFINPRKERGGRTNVGSVAPDGIEPTVKLQRRRGEGTFGHGRLICLLRAAIACQLVDRRDALLANLMPALRATLPITSVPGDQLWLDLTTLNLVHQLQDGSFPLAIWLSTAVELTGPRIEACVFQDALEEMRLSIDESSPHDELGGHQN